MIISIKMSNLKMDKINPTLKKETKSTIKINKKKYISLITIIFLGVSFYVGMKTNTSILQNSMINYFDEYEYSDIRIMSKKDINDTDIANLKNEVTDIEKTEKKYYTEAISNVYDKESDEYINKAFAVHSYNADDTMNRSLFLQGRGIESEEECVVDASIVGLGYELGDQIPLMSNGIEPYNYVIVGFVRNPQYISVDRGISNLLQGEIDYFIYIDDTNFKKDEAIKVTDIKLSNKYKPFTEKYNSFLESKKEQISSFKRKNDLSWNIYTRNDNVGYSNYYDDTLRLNDLAKVFPLLFFVVASLVTATSIARLVQEERRKIGIFKTLGYNEKQIMYKYLYYTLTTTIFGLVLGSIIGIIVFPKLVLKIYTLQYFIPYIKYRFDFTNIIFASILSLISTVLVAYLTVKTTSREKPVELMKRKKSLMKRSRFIHINKKTWNKLPFTMKVTFRNIFQRKIRSIMAIIGIAGCTALIVTGFGFLESMRDIVSKQYNKIINIDAEFFYKSDLDQNDIKKEYEHLKSYDYIDYSSLNRQETVKIKTDYKTHTLYCIIPDNIDEFSNNIKLYSTVDKEEINLGQEDGIVITEKIAKLLNVSPGDEITFIDNDNVYHTATISNITENYIFHYIYMNKNTYKNIYEYTSENNVAFVKLSSNDDVTDLKDELFKTDKYSSFISIVNAKENAESIISRFYIMVCIIIISAGLLAFVVLYNFSKLNISERTTEVASLKAMGYNAKQINRYINYETITLTIIGIIIGLIFGHVFTDSMLTTCEVDNMMFYHGISYISYFYGVALTFVFYIIINKLINKDLKNINMADTMNNMEE